MSPDAQPAAALPARAALPRRNRLALLRRLPAAVGASCRQMLHVMLFRYLVGFVRYFWFVTFLRRLRFYNPSGAVADNTIQHNYRGMLDLAVARSETLLRPLSVIDRVAQEAPRLKVLCVGPRTEGELLNLVAYGFRWKNVRGLDLISYSPRIDLGDMHAMPYADNSWDVVILGWVLAYSTDQRRAAQEVVRVARPGAVVAVGVEYNPQSDEEIAAKIGYDFGSRKILTTVDELLACFGAAVDAVYVRHDVAPERRDRLGAVYTLFSIRK